MKLLDAVNNPRLLTGMNGLDTEDRLWLAAFLEMCRRRLSVSAARRAKPRAKAHRADTGTYTVLNVRDEPAEIEMEGLDPLTAYVFDAAPPPRASRKWGGLEIASYLANEVNRIRSSPADPLPPDQLPTALSGAARRVVTDWTRQWEDLRHRAVRRCRQAGCSVNGGRFFVAGTRDKDCAYCRRGSSKATRWRASKRHSPVAE